MDITKRNGEIEVYDNNKISIAIKKSFISTGKEVSDSEIAGMVSEVEQFITDNPELRTVEDIQNRVEKWSYGSWSLRRGEELHPLPLST